MSGGHTPQQILSNEDRLSDHSESSLSVESPIVSDDNEDEQLLDLDESETGSDSDWEVEPEGDANRGQNLQFRLQAAAAGEKHLFFSFKSILG